jgi:hypothetical protein
MQRLALALASTLLLAPSIAAAQDPAHAHEPTTASWVWGAEAVVFAGYNYQRREFTDFDEVESQNWLTTSGSRAFGASRLRLSSMLSFEAFTLRDIGSPQVFQTGETFEGAPLIDYQHPHDLLMNLGGDFTWPAGGTNLTVAAYLVGPAPLGPAAFMHRPSAAENPQAPLSHHYLDATHITPGVISAGIERGGWKAEAGVFQGREPDEDRLDVDLGGLDSYSARLSWTRGPWSAQVSGAALTTPERTSPYDAKRVTGSLSYFAGDRNRSLAWLAAFGQNREVHGDMEAYLFEATARISTRHAFYTRAEAVAKDILDAGFHPIGTSHTHRQSPVGALTVGYVREIARPRWGGFGIGGDITGYRVPANLRASYGTPASFHLFVRYRGRAGGLPAHVH